MSTIEDYEDERDYQRLQYNEYMRQYQAKRYEERRLALIAHLGGQCVRCGTTESLEFDHVNPLTKTYSIGKILNGAPWGRILGEATKMQLLCRPHHEDKSKYDAALIRDARRLAYPCA